MSEEITKAFLRFHYGACSNNDGVIVIVSPTKTRPLGIFRLVHIDQAAAVAVSEPGAFFKIGLMNYDAMMERQSESRKTNPKSRVVGNIHEVQTVVCFALDVDANKADYQSRKVTLDALDRMPKPPSVIVNSDGLNGGFHAYWTLKEPFRIVSPEDRAYISDLTRRWQNRLQTLLCGRLDTTANIDRVLRPVGSVRTSGNMVSIHRALPDARYALRELTLPADESEVRRRASTIVKREIADVLGHCSDTDDYIGDYIAAAGISVESLLLEAGYQHVRGSDWLRAGGKSGLSIRVADDFAGINIFSDGDSRFPSLTDDGSVGRAYTIFEMFSRIRFAGDKRATYAWCRQAIETKLNSKIDLGGLLR